MRKSTFLLLALCCLVGGSAWGQTDVTSTYLVNPSFDDSYTRFLDINTDRGVEKPDGWSVEWYQAAQDQNGMTYVKESMEQDSKKWEAVSDKAYFGRMRWGNAILYLRQTMVDMNPGSYTLSFKAAAHTSNSGKNKMSVSVAGETTSVTVGSNESGSWSDYTVNFTITSSTPYATVEIKAEREADLFKFGIDELTLTYDGSSYYSTLLSEAQTLLSDNQDWTTTESNTTFSDAITSATGKETVADQNAAIVSLKTAIAAYKEANSVDVTAKITNPNYDSDISGWTCTGGDGNDFGHQTSSQTNFTGGFLEKLRNGWNGSYNQANLDISQTLSNLPNGEYTVKAVVLAQMQGGKESLGTGTYKDKKHGGPYYIDDEKGVLLYVTSGENNCKAWANTQNPSFVENAGGEWKQATVKVENNSLTIGLKAVGSTSGANSLGTYANWIAVDTWTLSYFGFDASGLLAELSNDITSATTLYESSDKMSSVKRDAIKTAIDAAQALVDADTGTKAEITTASTNLANAVSAANASITDYANLKATIDDANKYTVVAPSYTALSSTITAAQTVYDNGSEEDCATTISGLVAAKQAANVADDSYVTSTFAYAVELGTWTTEGPTGEMSSQHYDGTSSSKYLEQSGAAWGQSSWTIKYDQDLTLPAGNYVFKVAGRKAAGNGCTLSLVVKNGDTEIGTVNDFPEGDNGLGINKAGTASFNVDDSEGFANDGNGRGWQWRFVKFTLAEDATVNVAVCAEATAVHQWVSFCDATVQTDNDANIAMIAYNIKKNDANKAIEANENVRGPEYTTLKAAVDADPGTTKTGIETATTTINNALTAFNEAVTAYNELSAAIAAVTIPSANVGTAAFQIPQTAVDTYTNAKSAAQTVLDATTTSDKEAYTTAKATLADATTTFNAVALNAPADGAKFNAVTTFTGDAAWNNTPITGYVNASAQGGYSQQYGTDGIAEGVYRTNVLTFTPVTDKKDIYLVSYETIDGETNYLCTGSGGGYGGNASQIRCTTDVEKALEIQVQATDEEGIWKLFNTEANQYIGDNNDKGVYTTANHNTFQLVELVAATMTITDAKYATFVAPFNVEIPSGVTAYTVAAHDGNVLTLEAVATTIPANTPVVLNSESEVSKKFYGAKVDGTPTVGYLTGVYTDTDAPVGSYVLQNNGGVVSFYQVAKDKQPTVGANHAYLTIPSGIKEFFLDEATAINSISVVDAQNTNAVYNLAGQQVDAAYKGIIIKNGKKVLVK